MLKIAEPAALPQCSVDYAFQRISGKYKGRILWHLGEAAMRYGALRRCITGVTPKMLTQALRELEDDQLVSRHVYLEVPPRVEYALTETGRELIPFITLLRNWGEKEMARNGLPSMSKLTGCSAYEANTPRETSTTSL